MPFNSSNFAKDLAKYARLTNIQHGLPGAVRGAPAAAIIVGGAIASQLGKRDQDTGDGSVVENWLGVTKKGEEVVFLGSPPSEDRATSGGARVAAGEGIRDLGNGVATDGTKGHGRDSVGGQAGNEVKS